MAIASVKIKCEKCGKIFEFRKECYNRDEANKQEAWASSNITVCPDCYREEKAAEKRAKEEKEVNAAAEATNGINLVKLTGTEKQIAWAEKIRMLAISKCLEDEPTEEFYAKLNEKTSASWWINNRNDFNNSAIICATLITK